jgi:uncharacterized damage-inducible protein DinB
MITTPEPHEYAPFYAGYVQKAIAAGNVLQTLHELKDSTCQFFLNLPPDKEDYAYAEGKWTVKQLLSHLIDAERIFAYRALRFSRGDGSALPGFDENIYVVNAELSGRTLVGLAAEFKAVREANLYLYQSFTPTQLQCTGVASGSSVSVRALLFIAAGHELHHLSVLKERYL